MAFFKKTKTDTAENQKPKKQKTEYVGYQSFRLQKRIKGEKITGSFRLLQQSFVVLGRNWKLFLGIAFWYALLTITLVQGLQTASSVNDTKEGLQGAFGGDWADFAASTSLFIYFLGGSADNVSGAAATYQGILALIFSLVIIWTLRQLYATEKTDEKVRVRDGFYLGMSQLVQFVLVLIVVALQLIPLVIGGTLFSSVFANGVATGAVEYVLWGALFFILALISLYMVTSSLFALYIVTLPGMTPLAALRSARQLVRNRRWAVMRKVVFLPVAVVVMAAILTVPIFLFAAPVAAWMLLAISMLLLPIAHSYMYATYRALI